MSTPDGAITEVPGFARGARRSGTVWPTLRAIYIIWYRDVLRFWRDRLRLVASLAQPLLFLIVFGTGLSSALQVILRAEQECKSTGYPDEAIARRLCLALASSARSARQRR